MRGAPGRHATWGARPTHSGGAAAFAAWLFALVIAATSAATLEPSDLRAWQALYNATGGHAWTCCRGHYGNPCACNEPAWDFHRRRTCLKLKETVTKGE